MEVSGYVRGVPTYADLNGKTYGMLCETKEKCITDDSGVALDFKLEELRKQIERGGGDASTLEGYNAAHFATAESVTNITNGTTQVGNADKLDGHEAEYFAIKGEPLEKTPLLEKALTLSSGTHEFVLEGGDYTGGDLPNVNYAYGTATVKVRSSSAIVVILWGRTGGYYPQINFYNGTVWSGWKELFTTAGGTLTGVPYFGNKKKYISWHENDLLFGVYDSENSTANTTRLQVGNATGFDLANALILSRVVNGAETKYQVFHTGNSAKVVISETEPSDKTALWVW